MKHINYLFLLVVMLCSITAYAQQDFNPDNPPEPAVRYRLTVKANPAEAAQVSGSGSYAVNQSVYVSANSVSPEWSFVNWTKKDGTIVNTSTSFYYRVTNASETLVANYEKVAVSKVTLSSLPNGRSNLYGAGTYKVGQQVNIQCSPYNDCKFLYWATADGVKVSDKSSFTYKIPDKDVHLVAHLKFDPLSPDEPSEVKAKHRIYLTASPQNRGSFNLQSGTLIEEGQQIDIHAYNDYDWKFKHWEKDGAIVSTDNPYRTTMGTEDLHLKACFKFSPGNPGEPVAPNKSACTLYGVQTEMYKGQQLMYPIYLENTGVVTSLSFKFRLPKGFSADASKAKLSASRALAYQLKMDVTANSEAEQVCSVNISGGTEISGNNGILLYVPIRVDNSVAPQSYRIRFEEGVAMSGEQVQNVTFRHGVIKVSSLDESGLRAQFMVDIYLNRVQFTNNSTKEAKTFVWDFGDGTTSTEKSPMHIYPETGGMFNVKLTAKGEVMESVAEQTININAMSAWTASGDYILNETVSGVRIFKNMSEALGILSKCKVNGNMSMVLDDGKNQTIDLRNTETLGQLLDFSASMQSAGCQLSIKSKGNSRNTFNVILPERVEHAQQVIDWCRELQLNNVVLQLNGLDVDLSVLNLPKEQRICTGSPTTLVPLASLSANQKVSVEWVANIAENNQLKGYVANGKGNIPVMTLENMGRMLGSLNYHVTVKISGHVVYAYDYVIYVKPSMKYSSISNYSPSNNVTLTGFSQTLSWSYVENAIGFRVEVKRLENGAVVENLPIIELDANSRSCVVNNLKPGAQYCWQVFAIGECDELAGDIWNFSIAKRSDLIVEKVVAVDTAYSLNTIMVEATISNRGEGATFANTWMDGIYYSSKPDDFAHASFIKSISHNNALQVGESYKVTFEVTVPDKSLNQVYYYVKTDVDNNEIVEISETNNVGISKKVLIAENHMSETEYAALKCLYEATNGSGWTKTWNITSNEIGSGRWPGVTFDNDGHVVGIRMNGNRMVGTIPSAGFVLPYLRVLELSNNQLKGDVALFVKGCPALVTLDMSDNQLKEMSEPLSPAIESLNLKYQHHSGGYHLLKVQKWNINKVMDQVELTAVQTYDHLSQSFTIHPNLDLYSHNSGSYLGSMTYGDNGYVISLNGDYQQPAGALLDVVTSNGVGAYSKLVATLSYEMGDANADGEVSVYDAQQTLNRILVRHSGNFNFSAADTWTDQIINVQDIVKTINIFMDKTPEIPTIAVKSLSSKDAADGALRIEGNRVVLHNNRPVAAIDMTLAGLTASQVALRIPSSVYQMVVRNVEGGVRVVIFSPSGSEIATGENVILACAGPATLVRQECADIDAQPMHIDIEEVTGIDRMSTQKIQVNMQQRQVLIMAPATVSQARVTIYDSAGKVVFEEACHLVNGRGLTRLLPEDFVGTGIVKVETSEFVPCLHKVFVK